MYTPGMCDFTTGNRFKMVEMCISLIGVSLIRMVRSIENKTDERDKRKIRTKEKSFGFCLFIISLICVFGKIEQEGVEFLCSGH